MPMPTTTAKTSPKTIKIPEQYKKVLVLQGGGALGAYQLGVYQALHEKQVELDWVIGTSIGAINGGIIAGNPPEQRYKKLQEFWQILQNQDRAPAEANRSLYNLLTISYGVKGFFKPSFANWIDPKQQLGIEEASYYSTQPLKETLSQLIDLDYLNSQKVRLTVGAVCATTGEMRYFDSSKEHLTIDHIMASGALPPAFPAVRIDGVPYWDGGIYSNTPIEAVLNDYPRESSIIFSVQLWNPVSAEPNSIQEVMTKLKDIQFSSRDHFLLEEKKIHRLRHIIRQLTEHVPAEKKKDPKMKELMAWGCSTVMHIIHLTIDKIEGEDQMKDIDFTIQGINQRSRTGYLETSRAIESEIWLAPHDATEGILIHSEFR
jgi:NTE family protein